VVLIAIVLIFVVIRIVVDVPNFASGSIPDESLFEHRYARYPWLAYAHILPGVVFLLIAPFRLWRSFRNRNPERHRRLGRIAFTAGLLSGVFAIIFGFFQPSAACSRHRRRLRSGGGSSAAWRSPIESSDAVTSHASTLDDPIREPDHLRPAVAALMSEGCSED